LTSSGGEAGSARSRVLPGRGLQSLQMSRNRWVFVSAVCAACGFAFYLLAGRVGRPPRPAAATLPASARALLQPVRKDSIELTVAPQSQGSYQVGMQAGATLVYAWSTGRSGDTLSCEFADQQMTRSAEAHSAFVAQSSGWYRWRWKNQSGHPISIHLKLRGYYEPASIPYDK